MDFLFGLGFELNVTPTTFHTYSSCLQNEIFLLHPPFSNISMLTPPPPPPPPSQTSLNNKALFITFQQDHQPNSHHQKNQQQQQLATWKFKKPNPTDIYFQVYLARHKNRIIDHFGHVYPNVQTFFFSFSMWLLEKYSMIEVLILYIDIILISFLLVRNERMWMFQKHHY